MKRITITVLILSLISIMMFCGCENSNKDKEPDEYEIAMIADKASMNDGAYIESVWDTVSTFADSNGIKAKCYKSNEATETAYLQKIEKAVSKKAKLIIMAGSSFETTAYNAQHLYPEVKFLLIDGVPHDAANTYGTSGNTVSVIFAEEEAGYLAGYAAVKDGYKKIAFMGGQEIPSVKRYGYGFVQGIAAAAAEMEQKIELRYLYTGTFDESDDVKKTAADLYKSKVEVIFACGGGMGKSVMKAAEKNGGKVIGVDCDQSTLSNNVITSAKKNCDVAINDMLENYISDKFVGGTAFNYAAKNNGVSLEIENAHFTKFDKKEYNKVLRQLKNGKIQLRKDTGVNNVNELVGEWVIIK